MKKPPLLIKLSVALLLFTNTDIFAFGTDDWFNDKEQYSYTVLSQQASQYQVNLHPFFESTSPFIGKSSTRSISNSSSPSSSFGRSLSYQKLNATTSVAPSAGVVFQNSARMNSYGKFLARNSFSLASREPASFVNYKDAVPYATQSSNTMQQALPPLPGDPGEFPGPTPGPVGNGMWILLLAAIGYFIYKRKNIF